MFAPGRRIGFYGSGAGLVGSIYSLTGSLQLTLIQGGPELMDGRGYMVGVSIATIVAESWEPGARVADVARRHDATRWQIYKWRQLARRGDLPLPAAAQRIPSFATVFVEEPPAPAAPPAAPRVIELVVDDVVIRAPEGAAAEHLARAIRAARLAAP